MSEARAVSLRKGTTAQHDLFTGGVEGEVTVDTQARTLWVHSGDGQKGTPLARADFNNINAIAIENAANMGLAKTNLSNVVLSNVDAVVARSNLDPIGYAYNDTTNINTADLVDATKHTEVESNGNKPLAYADLSNTNVVSVIPENTFVEYDLSNLQTSSTVLTNAFAKKDLSNVNTTSLATNAGHTGNNLAYANLSNIETLSSEAKSEFATYFQTTENMIDINSSGITSINYPSAASVKAKFNDLDNDIVQTNGRIDEVIDLMPTDPSENGTYKTVYFGFNYKYAYTAICAVSGTGYVISDEITVDDLKIVVTEVNSNGGIVSFDLIDTNGKTDKTRNNIPAVSVTGVGTGAIFNLEATTIGNNDFAWNQLDLESKVPVVVTGVEVEAGTGIIDVSTSKTPRLKDVVRLIGGASISGTWSGSDRNWEFTPTTPSDVLMDSWVIIVK